MIAALLAVVLEDRSEDPARQERLQRLFTDHYRAAWRIVRRLGLSASSAEDAVQQAFLVTSERLGDIRTGSERAFLFATAVRICQAMRRKEHREQATEEQDARHSVLPPADELLSQKRARELLDESLEKMGDDLRAVFVLFEIEGLRTPEIAEIVGIPLGTAASRLRRAREQFRDFVERHATLMGGKG